MAPKRIHLVFKTHLDIGFTDHAEKVRALYHERFIPQAIATGAHFYAENSAAPKFIWTTGAWLIWDHLNSASPDAVRRLEDAIEKGLVRWHGLPFTTHSELMSPDLFRAGLSYSAELDKRFGKTTRAAKMTDVPGHTLGIIPGLAEAGIRFLHIGVNSASPPPEVPDLFRWQAPSGAEVVVMYQHSYGETHIPAGFDDGLSFAHTNDNLGPQAIHQIIEVYRLFARQYPETELRAATLEDFGELLWAGRERFPVVTEELGDSWIHGVGSDPIKTQRFLQLQRLYDGFAAEGLTEARLAFGRRLTMVPEHTWGVDIKTFLRDETGWDRPAFEALRKTDYRFTYSEASWTEQRAYLDQAVDMLAGGDVGLAKAAIMETEPPPAPVSIDPLPDASKLRVGDWVLHLDVETGDILELEWSDGFRLVGTGQPVLGYRHESYDATDIHQHLDTYLTDRYEWAILDHDKPGLDQSATARSASWCPRLAGFAEAAGWTTLLLEMPMEAHEKLGAPRTVEYGFRTDGDGLYCRIVLRNKPANRMPEAGFLAFAPKALDWSFLKLGLWFRAGQEVPFGGGALQAVADVRARQDKGVEVAITPLDTPLVGPNDHPFMQFPKTAPSFAGGIRFNLYNNKWGTNFPMWWEGDFAARFRIGVTEAI